MLCSALPLEKSCTLSHSTLATFTVRVCVELMLLLLVPKLIVMIKKVKNVHKKKKKKKKKNGNFKRYM